ncbi:hypothetical protein S-MbCM100_012 [Synechococcus phage S-MbCM100]|uniref:Uncharacterized protein n=1 Tax=Synechococcus phage S-MbCM100 TaxID=1340812 RepID=V5UTI3_9CAUD|nr:hypothetical protein S-MbCM100_012 [Synechococcus phage S-MbCM100]AHB80862.1 hypothetical protein S-MbCM100_012 [Synechococcus phage S-MbCM100]
MSDLLVLFKLLKNNFRTLPKSEMIFRGLVSQRIPSNNEPIPTVARINPPNFSPKVDSSDNNVYNPSIVLVTPNTAQSLTNFSTLLITSSTFFTFFRFSF